MMPLVRYTEFITEQGAIHVDTTGKAAVKNRLASWLWLSLLPMITLLTGCDNPPVGDSTVSSDNAPMMSGAKTSAMTTTQINDDNRVDLGEGSTPVLPTLERIRQTQQVVVGYRPARYPFSYQANSGQAPIGYSIDLSNHIVEAIKKHTNTPDLMVKYQPINNLNQAKLLQAGEVDFECSTTSNTTARQKDMAFSVGIFMISSRILSKKNSGINEIENFRGKKIAVLAGSTSEQNLTAINREQQLDITMVAVDSPIAIAQALTHKQADAAYSDDILLKSQQIDMPDPNMWQLTGTPRQFEIYACTFAKNNPKFKQLIDSELSRLYASTQINSIYDKWFVNPDPVSGRSLNQPMSPENQQLFSQPFEGDIPKSVLETTQNITSAIGQANTNHQISP